MYLHLQTVTSHGVMSDWSFHDAKRMPVEDAGRGCQLPGVTHTILRFNLFFATLVNTAIVYNLVRAPGDPQVKFAQLLRHWREHLCEQISLRPLRKFDVTSRKKSFFSKIKDLMDQKDLKFDQFYSLQGHWEVALRWPWIPPSPPSVLPFPWFTTIVSII